MNKHYMTSSSYNNITGFLILGLLLLATKGKTQSFWDDVMIIANVSIGQDDNRLFNWTGSIREYMERSSNGVLGELGTWGYGISIQKPWLHSGRFTLRAGVGYNFEYQTFTRRIDHCYNIPPGGFCTEILNPRINDYKIHMIQVPVNIIYKIVSGLNIYLLATPMFDFYKNPGGLSHAELNFYSLEVSPGIEYNWDQFKVGINYRLWQMKKVDPVYISTGLSGTKALSLVHQSFEHYNPVKVGLNFGYRLGGE